jgi:outer membrane protein
MTRILHLLAAVLLVVTALSPALSQAAPPVLTEGDAVALALKQNPTLEIARRELNIGLIQAERARPALRPELTGSASQIFRTPRVDLPGTPDEVILPNSLSQFRLDLRQPLYQFGAGKAPAERAAAMAAAARSEYRTAELDTIQQVREAYAGVVRAEGMSGVSRRGLELAEENRRLTGLLQERGLQAEVDVLEADRALAEAQAGRVRAENGIALARGNLNRLLGRSIDDPFAVEAGGALPAEPAPLAELTAQAMAQRPEAETLRQQIAQAEAGIRLAKASRLPRVNLEASYALQTKTVLQPRSGLAAGVSLTFPIFDGGVTRFTVREAEERLAQLRSGLTALEQGMALEIEQQRLAMAEARARRELAGRAAAAAEKALEITRLRLERGRAVQAEVLNARLALERALGDRVAAESDLRLAGVRLERAVGR